MGNVKSQILVLTPSQTPSLYSTPSPSPTPSYSSTSSPSSYSHSSSIPHLSTSKPSTLEAQQEVTSLPLEVTSTTTAIIAVVYCLILVKEKIQK